MGFHLWMITKMMIALSEVIFLLRVSDAAKNVSFDENYKITWGNEHVQLLNQGQEVQLSLDNSSGAGFGSKSYFGSGCFQMKIKLPDKDSGGIVTAFYLFLNTTVHEEMDFEFLGNRPGKPVSLQTNVFTNGLGGREQKFSLWFDPGADFHYYKLLWNDHQVVFFVDDTPIRVYKNNIIRGVGYPNHTLQVIASFWDGSSWATDGGKTKVNFSNAPFHVNFQDFNIDGCISIPNSPNKDCGSQKYWWNTQKYWQLNPQQLKSLEDVRKKYMNYDYCIDKSRYPTPRPECSEK
ncbi:xyloglucan endotransglucosylase/hydrolase protein 2-like [Lactuca sativa]|uniref:xyloglucan endotransglucosylase/hydrolase protein 2-like n=1 Tax=Lactuca sativa TaxID=4236 RepID=UPI0022B020F3|nr:xyloglucan endotransglucosylase/hydrolase protein 2-like [Lactuca sativa]